MPKDTYFHIRTEEEFKTRVETFAKENGFDNISDFIIDTLKNRMDPGKVEAEEEARLLKMLEKPHFREKFRLILSEVPRQ